MRTRLRTTLALAGLFALAAPLSVACNGQVDAAGSPEPAGTGIATAAALPEVVMEGVGEPSAVVVSGEDIVVATRATRVGRERVEAGALFVRTTHAPDPKMLTLDARGASFGALAVDEGTAFVAASDGRILAEPLSGGAHRTLATLGTPATALVAVAPYVLAAQSDGTLVRIDTRTGEVSAVAEFPHGIHALARRDASVVVAAATGTGGAIAEVAADGTVTTLTTLADAPCALSADARKVAWTTAAGAGAPHGRLALLERGASTPRTVTEVDAFACAVAGSGDDLFFATAHDVPAGATLVRTLGASLMRASAAGGAPSPVTSAGAPRVHPGALTATDAFVYWLTSDAVVRLAK